VTSGDKTAGAQKIRVNCPSSAGALNSYPQAVSNATIGVAPLLTNLPIYVNLIKKTSCEIGVMPVKRSIIMIHNILLTKKVLFFVGGAAAAVIGGKYLKSEAGRDLCVKGRVLNT
jgi:hypothetical protein